MAERSLIKTGEEMGTRVETNGASGVRTPLTMRRNQKGYGCYHWQQTRQLVFDGKIALNPVAAGIRQPQN